MTGFGREIRNESQVPESQLSFLDEATNQVLMAMAPEQ